MCTPLVTLVPALIVAVVPLATTRGQCENVIQSPSGTSGKCGTVQPIHYAITIPLKNRHTFLRAFSSKSPIADMQPFSNRLSLLLYCFMTVSCKALKIQVQSNISFSLSFEKL